MWFGVCDLGQSVSGRIAVRRVAVVLLSGCQARFFYARRQREGDEGALRSRASDAVAPLAAG